MVTDYKNLLINKNFIYLYISQLLSQVTIQILNFLFILNIFNNTGSALAIVLLWIFYYMPLLGVGPFAATFVDMFDKRKILFFTNFIQALIVLFYILFYNKSMFLLYIIVFGYSLVNQFYVPSETAALVTILKKNLLASANGLFFLTQQSAIIVGFAIAGPLHRYFGFLASLIICSFFLFIATISVYFLPKLETKEKNIRLDKFKDFHVKLMEGYLFIKNNSQVFNSFIILIVLQISLTLVVINVPIISKEILGIPPDLGGTYLIFPTMFGAIISSLKTPRIIKNKNIIFKILKSGASVMSLILTLVILFDYILPKGLITLIVDFIVFMFIGYFYLQLLIPCQTLIQINSPEKIRGRVFGNIWFSITLISFIPILISGIITEIMGINFLIIIIAILFYLLFRLIKINKNAFLFD